MKKKQIFASLFVTSFLLLLLVFLAACGGGADEAIEDTGETDTSAVEESAESDTVVDDNPSATGSEEDSGELPPTPDTGSKVNATRATPAQVVDSETAVATLTPPANRINPESTTTPMAIDLVFVIDGTGSMAPELSQLKASLDETAAGLIALPGNPLIRYGFVIYRDENKEGSTQLFPLTESWTLFADNLMAVTAVGGGDYPEDVTSGLYQAITNISWQPNAAKLIILLGDAPPHMATTPTLEEATTLAIARNISIYTVGSDGIDEAGTAVFQQIAQTVNGRYLFLTDTPEAVSTDATAVYATTDLPTLLVDIVAEIITQSSP